MLDTVCELGVQGIEVNTGNWSSAPHCNLSKMKESSQARSDFIKAFVSRGLEIIALNANGNQLHPESGKTQTDCVHDTIRMAGELGVRKVCLMSGLPGGGPAEKTPNWVVSSWPPETQSILTWQWQESLLPWWEVTSQLANENRVEQLAIELHGNQLVYNVPTLLRLRKEIGPTIGANLDPSHLFWMGADPLAAIDALGEAIYHVHAKDTFLNTAKQATTSLLENGSLMDIAARSWSYITLGYGHGSDWWKEFCYRLRLVGYDEWLSIEHEDVMLSCFEGVKRSVDLLKTVAPSGKSDFKPQDI
jgi:sugar phosphate isomerase/epimerase